jgi:flagellar motor switch protein FliN/FliY
MSTPESEAAPADAQPAEFADLQQEGDGHGELNLDLIMDVPLSLTLEVGRAKLNVRDLLKLSQGSVVELDKQAGDPLDVYVNGTLIAHGEVVVVNDKFGIRLIDVVSTDARVESLQAS